ncbi:hypothetical protein [Variovorax sp. ZT4R33]
MRTDFYLPMTIQGLRVIAGAFAWGVAESFALARSRLRRPGR